MDPGLTLAGMGVLVLLGAVLGGVGGLVGIGGGIIVIPILGLYFGMSQQMAQGTALVMVTPNVVVAVWRYRQRHPMPLKSVALLGLTTLATTWPAARLAVLMDSHVLSACFAVFLIGLSGYILWSNRAAAPSVDPAGAWNDRHLPWLGLLSGCFAGLFSVGAGIVATPILVRYFGKRQAMAQGIALAVVLPGSLLALATYAHAGQVDWTTGALLGIGGIATISYGVALAHRLPERRLRRFFAVMLLGTAALMFRQAAA